MTDQKFFEITKNLEKLKVSVTRGLAEAQSQIEDLREDLKNKNEHEKLEDLENNLKKYAGLYHWNGVLFEDFMENFDSFPKIIYDEKIQKLKKELSEKKELIESQIDAINDLDSSLTSIKMSLISIKRRLIASSSRSRRNEMLELFKAE